MAKLTRRGLIKHTSVGAVAVGALVAAPGRVSTEAASVERAPNLTTNGRHEPLAAYVRDIATGEIALLIGAREIVVRDPDLVARLVKAAR